MGIVLPEGVLNNTNLQKVRDFVENKAKILLIVSIPQDVFIASGATVKPSLVFLKKFDEDEAMQHQNIVHRATSIVAEKYAMELQNIDSQLAKRGKQAVTKEEKKILKAARKRIEEQKQVEIKAIVKEQFDYEIPIAEVKKAGISTTGTAIENELIPLAEEFTPYRKACNLWKVPIKSTSYTLQDDGSMMRIRMADNIVSEPEPFYGLKK